MIEAQILYSRLHAICEEMSQNLIRISRSSQISEHRAFAVGIMTGDLKLAAQIQHGPSHLFALRSSARGLFEYFSYDVAEGDVFLVADPYFGGTQAQVITMAMPNLEDDELSLFPVVRAQAPDLAGDSPSGLNPHAFEVWQESVRLTPIKLYRAGARQRDLWRFLLANSRAPSLLRADLDALYACCAEAKRQIKALMQGLPSGVLAKALETVFSYSRERVQSHSRACLRSEVQATAELTFGGKIATVRVTLRPTDEATYVSFEGSSPQLEAPYNLTFDAAKAFATLPLVAPILDDIALNEGTLAPFDFSAPLGCLVNPRFPAATALGPMATGHLVSNAVTSALRTGGASEDLAPALHGVEPWVVVFSPVGQRAETEPRLLVPGFASASGGWGAPALWGDRLLSSAEEMESHHGFRLLSREHGDEAPSTMTAHLENIGDDLEANFFVPNSMNGGQIRVSQGATERIAASGARVRLETGSRITFHYERSN